MNLKGRPSASDRLREHFAIFGQPFDWNARQFLAHRYAPLINDAHFFGKFAPAAPAKHAFGGLINKRPGGIKDDVNDTPHNGKVKCPEPPPRHRGVEFLDAIPFMSDGLGAGRPVNALIDHRCVRQTRLLRIWSVPLPDWVVSHQA